MSLDKEYISPFLKLEKKRQKTRLVREVIPAIIRARYVEELWRKAKPKGANDAW